MRARRIPATLVMLLLTTHTLHANRRKDKDKNVPNTINICNISDQNSRIHCYCEDSQKINDAITTECWIFNGGLQKTDSIWTSFTSQANIETLALNVRADGGLDFVPSTLLRYLRKLKKFSIKYSSIPKIDTQTFINLTSVQEIILSKNKIMVVSKHAFYNIPNLTKLTLDENEIQELVTETFFELPALKNLYLTNNSLTIIQERAFKHLVNLADLDLDKNNIVTLKKECFDGLANLKRLNLRHNKLSALDSFTFAELWNLQELLLDYNEIYILAGRAFDGLSQLRKLSMSHNKLVTVTSGLLQGVLGLSSLDLRYNKLQKFTIDNLGPIYDNLKKQNSYINLDGNNFTCDCHLAWMHKLRHEARSIKVRTSLEKFVCKFPVNPSHNSHSYFESNTINSNNSPENEEKSQIKHYSDEPEEVFYDEIDDTHVEEKFEKLSKLENERTLLQIPVELLPCPQVVKGVTEKTYTYPSQNEAKDYRNLIQPSVAGASHFLINFALPTLPFLMLFRYGY